MLTRKVKKSVLRYYYASSSNVDSISFFDIQSRLVLVPCSPVPGRNKLIRITVMALLLDPEVCLGISTMLKVMQPFEAMW